MKTSENLIEELKKSEGYRSKAYLDLGSVLTIGYGTTKYPDGKRVKIEDTCTTEQADRWLRYHIIGIEKILESVQVKLTPNQYDALVLFIYNTGTLGTSLLKALNANDMKGAVDAMRKWVYITDPVTKKKVISKGLVNRRNKEILLFETGYR